MAGVLKIETKEGHRGEIKLPEEGILTNFHNYADSTLTARGYLDQMFKR